MQAHPHVLALIPARGGSKGVPRKNIRLLGGKPLVAHSCECARDSRYVARIVLSTDCPEIAEAGRKAGADVPFMRPESLAQDQSPTLGVIEHALTWLRDHESYRPEIIVLLQPTTPLRQAADVDQALERLLDRKADSVVSVCRVASHYHPEWQFTQEEGWLRTMRGESPAAVPTRRQLLNPTYIRNGAIYAFRESVVWSTKSIYGERCLAFEMPSDRSINIDSIEDWQAAEAALLSASNEERRAADSDRIDIGDATLSCAAGSSSTKDYRKEVS